MIEAMALGDATVRIMLVPVLSARLSTTPDPEGLAATVAYIRDADPEVREVTAHELRHLQTSGALEGTQAIDRNERDRIGAALLTVAQAERDAEALYELIWALWEFEYRPAVPWFRERLQLTPLDPDTRGLIDEAIAWHEQHHVRH